MMYDLFNQLVYTEGDFRVVADYTGTRSQFTEYDVYYQERWIGATNASYYMGAVRQIIHHFKKFYL